MQDNTDNNIVERRQFPRYAVRYAAKVYLDDKMLCGTIIDISKGGIGILLPKKFDIGNILDIGIRNLLNEKAINDIRFKLKIVWINKVDIEGMYRAGLEIIEISEDNLEKLRKNIIELSMHKE